MEVTSNKPADYINSFSGETKEDLVKLDKMITSVMPKATRVMWEGKFWGGSEQKIIGYGDLTYVGSSKKEVKWFVIGLAKQKGYITLFVNAVQKGVYLAEKHKDEIGKAKVGKSSIGFKTIADINFAKLAEIVKEAAELTT